MLKGDTAITITHETLKAALQLYFENKTFAAGACPRVTNIKQATNYDPNDGFHVTLTEAQSDKPADPGV